MEISIWSLKGQYGSNCIVRDTIDLKKLLNTKKCMSFRLKFLLDPWKNNIWDPWKNNRGQSVLPLGQNLLEILKKIQQRTIFVFYKSWSNFSETTVWVNLYCRWFKFFKRCLKQKWNTRFWWKLIKNPWENNMGQTESLTGQYGSDCIIFWRLMTILWKDNIDRTILSFMTFFCCTPVLENRINSKI